MNKELKGIELLYYLMKRFNMSYNKAIKEMQENNQDISFINNDTMEEIIKLINAREGGLN